MSEKTLRKLPPKEEEIEDLETGETPETKKEAIKPTPQKKLPLPKITVEDLDTPEAKTKKVLVFLTTDQHKKLKAEAYEKTVTMGTIVRESIDTHFGDIKTVKANPDNDPETIAKIEACMKEATGFFGSVDLEAFLICCQENELVADVWNKELIEVYLKPKIIEASKGMFSESLKDNTTGVVTLLQLNEENATFLCKQLGLTYDVTEAEAETEEEKKGLFEELI
ncbi:hypothetical protein E3J74_09135 [Candidatus Bathyarchaeota archaeon]|nr:MAG: hypothetical protein E3J74_09135 [Candidatus Bathyarchaeota archaeon]